MAILLGRNPLHILAIFAKDNAPTILDLFLECMPQYPINQADTEGNTRKFGIIYLPTYPIYLTNTMISIPPRSLITSVHQRQRRTLSSAGQVRCCVGHHQSRGDIHLQLRGRHQAAPLRVTGLLGTGAQVGRGGQLPGVRGQVWHHHPATPLVRSDYTAILTPVAHCFCVSSSAVTAVVCCARSAPTRTCPS